MSTQVGGDQGRFTALESTASVITAERPYATPSGANPDRYAGDPERQRTITTTTSVTTIRNAQNPTTSCTVRARDGSSRRRSRFVDVDGDAAGAVRGSKNSHSATMPTVARIQAAPTNRRCHGRSSRPVGNPTRAWSRTGRYRFVATAPTVKATGSPERRRPPRNHSRPAMRMRGPVRSCGRVFHAIAPATTNATPAPRNSPSSVGPNTGRNGPSAAAKDSRGPSRSVRAGSRSPVGDRSTVAAIAATSTAVTTTSSWITRCRTPASSRTVSVSSRVGVGTTVLARDASGVTTVPESGVTTDPPTVSAAGAAGMSAAAGAAGTRVDRSVDEGAHTDTVTGLPEFPGRATPVARSRQREPTPLGWAHVGLRRR
ncbi:hypothetical protein RHRU231_470192 [Rhodococcus ruber]|uniref:Uncharacterized protein n=1 Tax=Rhodococcus ruber TaxID=1830 RepID=A0A098BKU8_9NOCA|nr:hypothetical protein RHRU231_470192 [Rhodococcus ruber]